jgi:hypothetical protein
LTPIKKNITPITIVGIVKYLSGKKKLINIDKKIKNKKP